MAELLKKPGPKGRIIGGSLIVAAVISVFLIDWTDQPPKEAMPIRPLKTITIGSPFSISGRKYPGKVRATQDVDLAFEVGGTLIKLSVNKGDQVKKDQLLAQLDPRDYQNDLDAAAAERDRARAHRDRIKEAATSGAVSQQQLTDAQAAFEVANAKVNIKAKALDDTHLRAKYTGVIADTFVENFQNVQAKQPILSLQDVSRVEIEVNAPEHRVALSPQDRDKFHYAATFDYLPGRKIEVKLKEYSTEADPATQTFQAAFIMPAPEDVLILPGMTATVNEYLKLGQTVQGKTGFTVPLHAVPVDGLGKYYVWKVTETSDGRRTVHRADVKVADMVGNQILVVEGLSEGDRIAAAGVHLLQEGQQVRPLDSQTGADS